MLQTLDYYALKIADLSHGSKAEYTFTQQFDTITPFPALLKWRHNDLKYLYLLSFISPELSICAWQL